MVTAAGAAGASARSAEAPGSAKTVAVETNGSRCATAAQASYILPRAAMAMANALIAGVGEQGRCFQRPRPCFGGGGPQKVTFYDFFGK